MSPIDPRELKRTRRAYVDVIETDRLCGKCRYNLRGLPTNGRCPECGHPIFGGGRAHGFRRFSDNLAQAPLFYLKTLAFGAWLLAFAGIAMTIALDVTRRYFEMKWAIGAGVCALIWWVGVFIVTAPRVFSDTTIRDEALDGPHLRRLNRGANLSWMLAAAAWVVVSRAPVNSALETNAKAAAIGLMVLGIIGFITLGLQLAALADWAGDTALGERFRTTAWIMGLAVLTCVIARAAATYPGVLTGVINLIAMIAFVVGVLALLYFDWALIQLAGIATWAIHNNVTADETERRMQQERERREQKMADRTAVAIALQDAAPPPAVASEAPAQTAFESNRVNRQRGGAAPYEVEPDA